MDSIYVCLLFLFSASAEGCLRSQRAWTEDSCDSVQLVTREEWGARPPKAVTYIPTPVNMTFIHHTAGTWESYDEARCIASVQDIQNFHMDERGWNDIGYSFLFGEDGRVYEGRGWNVEGAHTRGYNSVSLGYCVIGNFMLRQPNELAIHAVQSWVNCGVELGYITADYELFGHRDAGCTLCPGDQLYELIKTWPQFSTRPLIKHC